MANQNPEQLALDTIDRLLLAAGWVAQSKQKINLAAATSMAVREYQTDIGPASYFNKILKGLTAMPDNGTFGYFDQNLVSDYGYEKAVIDGVLVPYDVFTIETKITKDGGIITIGEGVDKRENLHRFLESLNEDTKYSNKELDKNIFNRN